MISEDKIRAIEEATTGAELFDLIADAFEACGFGSIGGSNIVTPVEINKTDYEALPSPDASSNIYLVTNY